MLLGHINAICNIVSKFNSCNEYIPLMNENIYMNEWRVICLLPFVFCFRNGPLINETERKTCARNRLMGLITNFYIIILYDVASYLMEKTLFLILEFGHAKMESSKTKDSIIYAN